MSFPIFLFNILLKVIPDSFSALPTFEKNMDKIDRQGKTSMARLKIDAPKAANLSGEEKFEIEGFNLESLIIYMK